MTIEIFGSRKIKEAKLEVILNLEIYLEKADGLPIIYHRN